MQKLSGFCSTSERAESKRTLVGTQNMCECDYVWISIMFQIELVASVKAKWCLKASEKVNNPVW